MKKRKIINIVNTAMPPTQFLIKKSRIENNSKTIAEK